jgi:hypothetical protein
MRHMRLARVSAWRRMIFRADRTKGDNDRRHQNLLVRLTVCANALLHGVAKCDAGKWIKRNIAIVSMPLRVRLLINVILGGEEFLSDNPYFITLIDSDMPPASIFSKGRGFWQY